MANPIEEQLEIDLSEAERKVTEIENLETAVRKRAAVTVGKIKESEKKINRLQSLETQFRSSLKTIRGQLIRFGAVAISTDLLSEAFSDSPTVSFLAGGIGTIAQGAAIGGLAGGVAAGISIAVVGLTTVIRNHARRMAEIEKRIQEQEQLVNDIVAQRRREIEQRREETARALKEASDTFQSDVNESTYQIARRIVLQQGLVLGN